MKKIFNNLEYPNATRVYRFKYFFRLKTNLLLIMLLMLSGCQTIVNPLLEEGRGDIKVSVINLYSNNLNFNGKRHIVDWNLSERVGDSFNNLFNQMPGISVAPLKLEGSERDALTSLARRIPLLREYEIPLINHLSKPNPLFQDAQKQGINYVIFVTSEGFGFVWGAAGPARGTPDGTLYASGSGIDFGQFGTINAYSVLSYYVFDPNLNQLVYFDRLVDSPNLLQYVWDKNAEEIAQIKKQIKTEVLLEIADKDGESKSITEHDLKPLQKTKFLNEVRNRSYYICMETFRFSLLSATNKEITLNRVQRSVSTILSSIYKKYGISQEFNPPPAITIKARFTNKSKLISVCDEPYTPAS